MRDVSGGPRTWPEGVGQSDRDRVPHLARDSTRLTLVCQVVAASDTEFVDRLLAELAARSPGALVFKHEDEWTGHRATTEIWCKQAERDKVLADLALAYAKVTEVRAAQGPVRIDMSTVRPSEPDT